MGAGRLPTEDASIKAYSNSLFRASSWDCKKSALETSLKNEAYTRWVEGTCSSWTVSIIAAESGRQIGNRTVRQRDGSIERGV